MARVLRHFRAHDYPYLLRRWKAVAVKAGLKFASYAQAGGLDIYYLESKRAAPSAPSIYIAAGIHGDEAAATEGLLLWATKNITFLSNFNVLIFPCLNPWGLVNNSRRDADGNDLNRCFHDDHVPQIAAQNKLLAKRRFDLALMLHEDYDAVGMYIYEVPDHKPYWGEELAKAASRHVPVETRRTIEGRSARNGIVRPRITSDIMPDWPEALLLYLRHSARVFTIETPSEFHLDDRVAAQAAVITKAVDLARKEFSLRAPPGPA